MDQYPTYLTGNTALCADKRWVLARQNRLVILPGVGEVETLYPVEAAEVLPVSMGTVDTSKNM
ncbi:hypothetical protein PPTG_23593 [Phytophthora nicotianae INRA-310]|uniref:Uncharacterized protein n=2 Tax=Phytophthora nicotianae TaxID=4792 RepID=W2PV60_PHYN3|nr:hypothetical protein PPTG_23593 [Phytophthora nicotianae INRA-310]ETL33492.1 hypothetical protein L916_14052 [Phytophthora nicotianae]ETN04787.1 hypothetical protein PPTG_23593 [Phytophthora nicotianae INRA-310]